LRLKESSTRAFPEIKLNIMKKVLIITYYWPPSGGAGVQRWLKLSKFLHLHNCEPVIYTPENPEPPDFDETLLNDIPENLTVIKTPVWEPYHIYKKLTGKKKDARITHGFLKEEKSKGFLEKLSVWVRGNFFIPDARCFWVKPSIRFLSKYLQKKPVDLIISSGPPHSMHLIALGLKKKLNIPWLADFRDPWTEIDFYDKLRLTRLADRKHKILEKEVLSKADSVITVGGHLAGRLKFLGASNVEIIPNGFDEDDFTFLPVVPDKHFTVTHIGSINSDRNPETLWKAISCLLEKNHSIKEALRLQFVGKTDYSVMENLKKYNLEAYAEFILYLPHIEALRIAASSSALLLLINQTPNRQGIVTGKLFEYLATGRPVICIGPVDGEAALILNETKRGRTFEYDDLKSMTQWLEALYNENLAEKLQSKQLTNVLKYSRQAQAKQLAALIHSLV
jgi:glycosyltransferase involved in cell wall biosynthesis